MTPFPILSPLPLGYSFDDKTPGYRYDWTLGITLNQQEQEWWDWLAAIRKQRAIAAQLLIDSGASGCAVSEVSALLLTLLPSMGTETWMERYSGKLGDSIAKLSEAAQPLSATVSGVLKASAVMSNFLASGEGGEKNWFIYRFLDSTTGYPAIEWNINRKALEEHGTLLRGSIVLTFHGPRRDAKPQPLNLILRPRLGFDPHSDIAYIPPIEELDRSPLTLPVQPVIPALR